MKVYITPECHAEIMHYVHKSNVEISGLGRIQKNSLGEMVVTKVYLLEQENGPATTDIDKEAVAKLMFESREDPGHLNFWWHSHVNMATFWSGTDMETIKDFGKNGFLLATVFNKKGEFRTAYYQGATDFLPALFMDQIETSFTYIPRQVQIEQWDKEYAAKAKEKAWASTGNSNWGAGYYGKRWSNTKYYDDGYGDVWGEDALGLGRRDADVPSAHKDPDYYLSKEVPEDRPAETEEDVIVGYHSSLTVDELCSFLRKLYFQGSQYPDKALDLGVEDYLKLCDVYDILYGGGNPDPSDIEEIYDDVTGSAATMAETVYQLQEEAAKMVAQEEDYTSEDFTTEPVALKGAAPTGGKK